MCVVVKLDTKEEKAVLTWKLFRVENKGAGKLMGICHGGPYKVGVIYQAKRKKAKQLSEALEYENFQSFARRSDAEAALVSGTWLRDCVIREVVLFEAKKGQISGMSFKSDGRDAWAGNRMLILPDTDN